MCRGYVVFLGLLGFAGACLDFVDDLRDLGDISSVSVSLQEVVTPSGRLRPVPLIARSVVIPRRWKDTGLLLAYMRSSMAQERLRRHFCKLFWQDLAYWWLAGT